jgi:insulysin
MTLSRIYQRVLNDDLNSFVYDASLAGCRYSISCAPTGYKLSVRGYSEKLPILVDTLTTRMLSLIEELKEGKEKHPALFDRFQKAKDNLLRETKNYRLDTPYEVANYNSRLLMEESVWYLDNYIDEMEGENAERFPLTMEECGREAEACLSGNLKADALCIGNIDEKAAMEVTDVINRHFMDRSRPLNDAQSPNFRSMKLPTKAEAKVIFGPEVANEAIPVKYQEMAFSSSEENNAVELTIQVGCDVSLGYEGIGILDLIGHLAYSSAYNQLRTREQLGYIVSVYIRKTAGGVWGLTVVVQSSSKSPEHLEERIEEWLRTFRQELEDMTPEAMAVEARAVVVQLLEEDTKLSQEVGTWWNEIVATQTNHERMTTPAFDRLEKLADELSPVMEGLPEITKNGSQRKSPEELKARVLSLFDQFCSQDAPERRAMSSRVFSQTIKSEYEASQKEPGVLSTYSDMRFLKEYLSTWPASSYWGIVNVQMDK